MDIDDPDRNQQAVQTAVSEAAGAGAKIVVLPELVLTGSAFASQAEALERAEESNGPTATWMSRLAAELGLVLVVGFCERDSDGAGPYNSALVIDRGEILTVYRKTHLWDKEKLVFEPGSGPAPCRSHFSGAACAR